MNPTIERALELSDEFTEGYEISEDSTAPCWIVACGLLAKEVRRLTQEHETLVRECRTALANSELVQRGDERFLLIPYSFIKSSAFIED